MKKVMFLVIVVVVVVGTMSAGGAEVPYKWTVYNGTRAEWISLTPGEIIESKDLKNLLVGELRRDERVHWRWMSMTEWVELEMGENIIQLDSYRHAAGWDAIEVQAMDTNGVYHPIGKFPVRFNSEGDFWMEPDDYSIVSWGNGTIGISVAYKYDIEVRTCSNVTLVTFEQMPAGNNIVVSNIEEGDVIVIVGRDGDKRSLPIVYQAGEGDFALVNND